MSLSRHIKKQHLILIACILVTPLLTSCWVVAIKTFGAVFGQQLLSVAAHNYSDDYGSQLEELLLTMADETKKSFSDDQGQDEQSYADNNYNQQDNNDQQYAYQDGGEQVYAQQQYSDQGYNNQQNYSESNYNEQNYNQQAAYDQQQVQTQQPLALDIAVLAQRSSAGPRTAPIPINDGDTLYSIPGNPEAGDKIKISFKANANCYLYVVGIDATGYVASIFPDPSSNLTNPVITNKTYLVPGDTEWYGLDDYKGVEEIYFIASYDRRLDLERIIKKMSSKERKVPANYKNVQVAAVIPQTRGLVKVKTGALTSVKSSFGSTHSFKPTSFTARTSDADLKITRWFNHN